MSEKLLSRLLIGLVSMLIVSCVSKKEYEELVYKYKTIKTVNSDLELIKDTLLNSRSNLLLENQFLKTDVSNLQSDYIKLSEEYEYLKNNPPIVAHSYVDYESLLAPYKVPVELISSTHAFDQSILDKSGTNCDFEQIIRNNFMSHQLFYPNGNEKIIWFYDFPKRISENFFGGDSYLLEVFILDFTDLSKVKCQIKYFDSLEKRIGKLKNTSEKGEGLNRFRNLIKNCNG